MRRLNFPLDLLQILDEWVSVLVFGSTKVLLWKREEKKRENRVLTQAELVQCCSERSIPSRWIPAHLSKCCTECGTAWSFDSTWPLEAASFLRYRNAIYFGCTIQWISAGTGPFHFPKGLNRVVFGTPSVSWWLLPSTAFPAAEPLHCAPIRESGLRRRLSLFRKKRSWSETKKFTDLPDQIDPLNPVLHLLDLVAHPMLRHLLIRTNQFHLLDETTDFFQLAEFKILMFFSGKFYAYPSDRFSFSWSLRCFSSSNSLRSLWIISAWAASSFNSLSKRALSSWAYNFYQIFKKKCSIQVLRL